MPDERLLLPNLGAEEGDDWRAYRQEPVSRVAARLWSQLFAGGTRVRTPNPDRTPGHPAFHDHPVAMSWPPDLGPPPAAPAYDWLACPNAAVAWYRSATIDAAVNASGEGSACPILGPPPEIVARVHDKAFALDSARELDLLPANLAPLITILAPDELAAPDAVVERLAAHLARWPDWTRRRFTLKPRLGSSGRGRVAGVDRVDSASLRGALPRLAARGGAIFEPWLDRHSDLSVCLRLPAPDAGPGLPTLLGSLEMLATASGVYRGHCGEFDHRGRVFSGHRQDETLRAQAAAVAARAQALGYFGPCGIDAFTYVEDATTDAVERLRPVLEFNARPTMGLVALGLLRRALPLRRNELDLQPGDRRAFLLTLLGANASDAVRELSNVEGALGDPLCLAAANDDPDAPQPYLFFARNQGPLREAFGRCTGC